MSLGAEAVGRAADARDLAEQVVRAGVDKLDRTVGGPARRNAILALAAVLSLDSADQGAIGAVAPDLEPALHISNFQLGLLVTITALVGVIFTIPMGVLTDKLDRTRLLMVMIGCWGVAELLSAFSTSYWTLVAFRVALGGVTAVAAPAVASLTGDYFPPGDRGRIYGFIVAGELIGAGFGVLVAGEIAALAGWRPALAILALPSALLMWWLWRIPEPARGGQSWIPRGAEEIASAEQVDRGERPPGAGESMVDPETGAPRPAASEPEAEEEASQEADLLEEVEKAGFEPEEEIVLDEHPASLSLGAAVRYVLKVRTNVIIIAASSLGYSFFAGLKVFALLFVRGHYQISQGVATFLIILVGFAALVGVLVAGRGSDRLIARGRVTARVDIGILGYTLAAVLLAPALIVTNIGVALVLIMVAAAGIAAPNATCDAARLDIVPAQLWGRAESIRTAVRTLLEAFAPLVFGILSVVFGGHQHGGFGVAASGVKAPATSPGAVVGLEWAFLVMLVPLAASGLALIWAHRSYPVDVASAGESQRRMAEAEQQARARAARRAGGRPAAPQTRSGAPAASATAARRAASG